MRLIAEAGTDVAGVALWDPTALPETFDADFKKRPLELMEELQAAGRLFYTDTGADGAYLLHVFLDEPVAEDLEPYCLEPVDISPFHLPGGSLVFSGSEYVFAKDDAMLRKHDGVGTRMDVPAGEYDARFFRTEYPEGLMDEAVRSALGDRAGLHACAGCLFGGFWVIAVVGAVAMVGSWFHPVAVVAFAVGAAGTGVGLLLWKYGPMGKWERRSTEAQRRYPSIVAELRRRTG